MNSYVSDHKRIEERSLALHKEIASRILKDPRLLEIPRANLRKLEELLSREARRPPGWLLEWKRILEEMAPDELAAFLVSPDEKATRLRQSSPFSGILTPRERWKIYETF